MVMWKVYSDGVDDLTVDELLFCYVQALADSRLSGVLDSKCAVERPEVGGQ